MATVPDQLDKLAALLREGLITREQFDQQRDAMLASQGTAPPRPTSVGSYRLTGDIGHGGMGRVYRGRIGSISAPYKLNPLTTRRQSPQILV